MLGDSITNFIDKYSSWSDLLGHDSIYNYGIPYAHVSGLLEYPEKNPWISQVLDKIPGRVFLMIGINDAHHNVPLDETMANIKRLCDSLDSFEIEVIVQSVLPTTNYYDTLYGGFNKNGVLAIRSKKMNHRIISMCRKRGYAFLDLRPYLTDGEFLKHEYSTDGIHLNFVGYLKWKKALVQYN